MTLIGSALLAVHNMICQLFFNGHAPTWLQNLHLSLGIGRNFNWM